MSEGKISVIVPIYNVEAYLDPCVESIAGQTYEDLEIILVNDGSPDGSPGICDAWARRDGRVRVIHKQNGGVSSARNAGLEAAVGEYIGFVDGDDIIDADMYELLLKNLLSQSADISRCGMVRQSANGFKEVWGERDAPLCVLDRTAGLRSVGEAQGILPVSPCNKLFRRSLIADLRFDETLTFAEDVLFNYEAARRARLTVCMDRPKYHYIINDDSASHQRFTDARFDEHRVTDIIMSRERDNPDVYPYCVKGDVLKAFRTIKQMQADRSGTQRFKEIRARIVAHRREIFNSGLYSTATKLKTLLLWLLPAVYKAAVAFYQRAADHRYKKKVSA